MTTLWATLWATLVVLALASLLTGAGRLALPWLVPHQASAGRRLVLASISGVVLHHLLFELGVWLGVPWSWWVVWPIVGLLAGAAALGLRRRASSVAPRVVALRPRWGGVVLAASVVLLAVLGVSLVLVNPDFIAHWGYKAHRFALDGGVDFEFLRAPWRWYVQADYPLLVPGLLTTSVVLAGSFEPGALTLWSVLAIGGIGLAAREALVALGVSPPAREGGVAVVALAVLAFGVATLVPGAVDPLMALALIAAVAPLAAAPEDHFADREIGLLAAFAAASKVEGLVLGLLLIAARLMGTRRLGSVVAGAGLLVVVALSHHLRVGLEHLAPGFRRLDWNLDRLLELPGAVWRWYPSSAWFGLDLLVLFAPLMLLWSRARPVILVVLGLLLADVAAWVLAPFELDYFVASTLPRLLFQVMPVLLVVAVAGLDAWSRVPTPADMSRGKV